MWSHNVNFDWSVTLGGVLSIAANLLGLVIGAVVLYYKTRETIFNLHMENKLELKEIKQQLAAMEPKLTSVWDWFIRGRN